MTSWKLASSSGFSGASHMLRKVPNVDGTVPRRGYFRMSQTHAVRDASCMQCSDHHVHSSRRSDMISGMDFHLRDSISPAPAFIEHEAFYASDRRRGDCPDYEAIPWYGED